MPDAPRQPGRPASKPLRNAKGEELVVESSRDRDEPGDSAETVLATSRKGNSLTLLEEFSAKRKQRDRRAVWLSFACAATSLTFAALTYLKTH